MKGNRLYPTDKDKVFEMMKPGDYFKLSSGEFIVETPNGLVCSIRNHTVIEHKDGSITVSPSILVTRPDPNGGQSQTWHGFLENGTWREV